MGVFHRENHFFAAGFAALAVLAFAAPALAGTLYQWTTESGTASFTDDPKRVPARYRAEAEPRQMGKLSSYSRLTIPAPMKAGKAYGDRIDTRLESLREARAPRGVATEGAGGLYGAGALNVAIGDGNQLMLPLTRDGSDGGVPLTTEEHRVRLADTIATQDLSVTRRGDKILSRTLSPRNQRPVSEFNVPATDDL